MNCLEWNVFLSGKLFICIYKISFKSQIKNEMIYKWNDFDLGKCPKRNMFIYSLLCSIPKKLKVLILGTISFTYHLLDHIWAVGFLNHETIY